MHWPIWVFLGLSISVAVCSLYVLTRTGMALNFRLKANKSWSNHAKIFLDYLILENKNGFFCQSDEMAAFFNEMLKESNRFFQFFEDIAPSQERLLFGLSRSYDVWFGEYERKLDNLSKELKKKIQDRMELEGWDPVSKTFHKQ